MSLRTRLDALGEAAIEHPRLAIVLAVLAQNSFGLFSRDLWWSDEVRQAGVLRDFLLRHDWMVLHLNAVPYPDKPPVYFWLMGALATLLGSSAPYVFFLGLAMTVALFIAAAWILARRCGDAREAYVAVAILLSCPYLLVLAHYARMDFLFAASITASLSFFEAGSRRENGQIETVYGAGCAGAAMMIKGVLGALLPLAAIAMYLALQGRGRRLFRWDFGIGLVVLAVVSIGWAAGVAAQMGWPYVFGVLHGQVLERGFGHAGSPLEFLRYGLTLPLAALPWSLLLLWRPTPLPPAPSAGLYARIRAEPGALFAASALVSGLILLSVIREKHEYYLLPLFVPIAILAAKRLTAMRTEKLRNLWAALAVFFVAATVLSIVAAVLRPYGAGAFAFTASGAILAVEAIVLWVLRDRGLAIPLLSIVLGQTLWVIAVVTEVLPALNAAFSTRPIAEAMETAAKQGSAVAAFAMTPGVFAYDFRQDYFETSDDHRMTSWLWTHPKATVIMPESVWRHGWVRRHILTPRARYFLAGDTIVFAQKTPYNGVSPTGGGNSP